MLPILFVFSLIFGAHSLASEFPSPQGYVNDFGEVLKPETEEKLEGQLNQLEQDTGVELTVVLMESLQDATVEDFAVRLFEEWGVGKRGQDNGVLLLVAPIERVIRIEVGSGLESLLVNARAGRIIRQKIVSAFKEGDYDRGVLQGVEVIERLVREGEAYLDEAEVNDRREDLSLLLLAIFGWIIFTYLAAFLGRTKEIYPGAVLGGIGGIGVGVWTKSPLWLVVATAGLAISGLVLDYTISKNYRGRKIEGLPTSWRHSWGGFSSGKGFSFRGFGDGTSGSFGNKARP